MTCYKEISCPTCGGHSIMKLGRSTRRVQRYRCQQQDCVTKTFMLEYYYKAYEPSIKEQIVEMAINSSGIRDTARASTLIKIR
jgi:transposase-like protein